MSLYYLQKVLYDLNRSEEAQNKFEHDADDFLTSYNLTEEEIVAILKPDIGLLYVLGVNGQILMHYAAFHQIEWDDYLKSMRNGIKEHGQVRDGVYTMTGAGKNFTASTEAKPNNSELNK